MHTTRSKRRTAIGSLVLGAVMLGALARPAALLALDGQVIGPGTNIAGDVFLTGGHARINFTNLGDCPAGLGNGCFVEVKFIWRCQEPWCLFDDESVWYRVPAGQDYFTHPGCADGGNKWTAKVRLHFTAPQVHVVHFFGQGEYSFGANFLIPKFLFDANTSTGYSGGTFIATRTAVDAYAGESTLGQSNGYLAGPPSC